MGRVLDRKYQDIKHHHLDFISSPVQTFASAPAAFEEKLQLVQPVKATENTPSTWNLNSSTWGSFLNYMFLPCLRRVVSVQCNVALFYYVRQ